jgi:hypothetical protein
MKFQRFLGMALSITAVALTFASIAVAQVVVTPGNTQGWQPQTSGTSTVTFEQGPGTPPLGTGSVELSVGANGGGAAQLRNPNFAGAPLGNLSALNYWTYVDQDGIGGQAPYIILNVDYDGNGTSDDLLFFEPVYQTAVFCPSNPQPALLLDAWQQWNAMGGCWWSVNNTAGAGPGTNVKPLSVILAAQPNAALATTGAGTGAVRIVAGFGAGAWENFIGNVDAFTIGFNGNNVTFNFELYSVPNHPDQCKNGGWQTFSPPTGPFKNQGQCVSSVVSNRGGNK